MGTYVVSQLVKALTKRGIAVSGARVLIMGLTFKENCPDLRNTRVVDIVHELGEYGLAVDVYDPWVSKEEARDEYKLDPIDRPQAGAYDAIILAVAHREFAQLGAATLRSYGKTEHILYDLKYILTADASDLRL
jgi:UDP-N-acetyl-D-galactosamine dehydrogenase